jgi:hypothetical protein
MALTLDGVAQSASPPISWRRVRLRQRTVGAGDPDGSVAGWQRIDVVLVASLPDLLGLERRRDSAIFRLVAHLFAAARCHSRSRASISDWS